MPEDKASSLGTKFEELVRIMTKLRAPGGCPWDREQTHASLRQYLLEEAYEVLEAIDAGDDRHLQEELGDLLLQVIFHAQIAAEQNTFEISDVVQSITEKLIRRHPNVFGDTKIDSAAEQSVNWEKIKKQEGKSSAIDGVPRALSALLRAWRIQQKASTVGFDWIEVEPVWEKIHEELEELREACEHGSQDRIEEEFGDLLFSIINLSRFINVNPEDSLRQTIEKFSQRFKTVERHFETEGRSMNDATLEEMDEIWEKTKRTK